MNHNTKYVSNIYWKKEQVGYLYKLAFVNKCHVKKLFHSYKH